MIHCIVNQVKKLFVILNVPDDVHFIILKNVSRETHTFFTFIHGNPSVVERKHET